MARLGLILVWGIAATLTIALGATSYVLMREPRAAPEATPERSPFFRHDTNPWARWTITEQLSAHHVAIAHVETRHLDEAMSIAREIIEPMRVRAYTEIVIYFHRPGRPDPLPPIKIQWTPNGGYVTTDYREQ
ncbi:MAG: hypothetical protein AB7O67_15495 [Vicinamibacterales bacterium]